MSAAKFRLSDHDGFLFGLVANVVTLQWLVMDMMLKQQNPDIDLSAPVVQRCAGERVVDLVINRFGTTPAAADIRAMRDDLIQLVVDFIAGSVTPESPEPPWKLIKGN